MTKKPKRPRDVSQLAKMMVDIASGDVREVVESQSDDKRHIGGKKGGKARAKALPPETRTDIARMAALARWKKSD